MPPRALTLLCAVAVLAGMLAACGEDRNEGSAGSTATSGTDTTRTSATPAPSGAVAVKESEYRLDPSNPRVARAGVVSFRVRNAGKVTHALEVEGPGGEVKTGQIAAGASATLKADLSKPGSYEWYCPIDGHKNLGMKGRITVAGGGTGQSKDDSGMHDDSGKRGGRTGKSGTGGGGYDSGRSGGGGGVGGGY